MFDFHPGRILAAALMGVSLASVPLSQAGEEKKPADKASSEQFKKAAGREVLGNVVSDFVSDEKIKDADRYARSAAKSYQVGDYEKAVASYLDAKRALEASPNAASPANQSKIDVCRQGISRCYFFWSEKLYFEAVDASNVKDFDKAIELCTKAAEMWAPSKSRMETAIAKYKEMKKSAQYMKKVAVSKVDPELEQRNYSLDVLIRQASVLYKDRQFDKARDKYEEALSIDPYNMDAIEGVRLSNLNLYKAGVMRTSISRAEYVAEANWKMVSPITARLASSGSDELKAEEPLIKEARENAISKKLKTIIMDSIDFDEIEVPVVLKHLREQSRKFDPAHEGVNILLLTAAAAPKAAAKPAGEEGAEEEAPAAETATAAGAKALITMKTDNVSLGDVLNFIVKNSGLRMKVEKYAVILAENGVPLEQMETKIYPLEKEAVDRISGGDGEGDAGANAKKFFSEAGIVFPSGSSVVYDNSISRLIVTNTLDNLDKIEELIRELNVVNPQVLIQAKFVEVKLSDLEELGFHYTLSRSNSNEAYKKYSEMNTNVSGDSLVNVYQPSLNNRNLYYTDSKWSTASGITQIYDNYGRSYGTYFGTMPADAAKTLYPGYLYSKAPVSENGVTWDANSSKMLRGVSDFEGKSSVQSQLYNISTYSNGGYGFSTTVNALDQSGSADILSCPRITTMNGYDAMIAMVTERYFPSSWSDSEISTISNGNGTSGNQSFYTGSVPEFDDAERLGTELKVKPMVDATDNYTISMTMTPIIKSLKGWTDYSYNIEMGVNQYDNVLKMPIFEVRSVDTAVSCYDGETIILGGVVNDTTTTFDDRYPILGRLPLVGRLFQSKAKTSSKANLLIFLTCRLINPDGSPVREREMRGLPPFRQ